MQLDVTVALVLFALFGLPPLMSGYYTGYVTLVAIYSIVTLGLGLLVGRVGLYSLGQGAVLQIGAWTGARLLFATGQPFPLVMIEAGLVTMLIGTAIGLPALRLRGLYLALITLMFAAHDHGDPGHGELPQRRRRLHRVQRPAEPHPADPASVDRRHRHRLLQVRGVVAVLMFLLVYVHVRRPGRAGPGRRSGRASPPRSRPASTPRSTSCGRGRSRRSSPAWPAALLAGQAHYLYSIDFTTQDSIILLAVALMGGVYNLWGAVIAALLMQLLPAFLQDLGVSYDVAHDLVRRRRAAGADHRAGGHRRPVPEGHEETVAA